MNSSVDMFGMLLLAIFAGALLGSAGVIAWSRQKPPTPEPLDDGSSKDHSKTPKQEGQRFFLMNETGNVLISTSLSPSGTLPEATLGLFSEALSHLAAVFFAVARTNDPATQKPFSLYNYWALKRALEWHPAFIRVATENTEKPAFAKNFDFQSLSMLHASPTEKSNSSASTRPDSQGWLEERVKQSRNALGMDDSPKNVAKLRAIHSQLRAEAERLGTSRIKSSKFVKEGVKSFQLQQPFSSSEVRDDGTTRSDLDKMEIGHITLYCECLMGVSVVTVKLAHARFDDYLKSDDMEEDVYLFVSPLQLKKTMSDVSSLPQMNIS